jgi:hypothetical protein
MLSQRRRHLPPPRTNFEKLQDILKKRKGMDLDVSSSGALAASLDKCIVSATKLLIAYHGYRLTSIVRTRASRRLTLWSVLWRHVACSPRSISALEVWHAIPLVTMVSLAQYTLTLLVPFAGMPVCGLTSFLAGGVAVVDGCSGI